MYTLEAVHRPSHRRLTIHRGDVLGALTAARALRAFGWRVRVFAAMGAAS
jgi:hypothetical protein